MLNCDLAVTLSYSQKERREGDRLQLVLDTCLCLEGVCPGVSLGSVINFLSLISCDYT